MENEQVSDRSVDSSGKDTQDTISHEAYKKLLGQRKADQEKIKSYEAKLQEVDSFVKEKEAFQEKKLQDEGNWKALLEQREKKAKELEAKLNEVSQENEDRKKTLKDAVKINAFINELGGKLKKREYYSFIDTDKIALDPETNAVDEVSLKSYVQEFATSFRELVHVEKNNLPSEAAKGVKNLTHDEWLKLPLKEKKARMKDVKL